MKNSQSLLLFLVFQVLFIFNVAGQQTIFELSPAQSMCITGKGPGQDGAINPFVSEESIAIVQNIGKSSFVIRLQDKSVIKKEIPLKPGKTKEINLFEGAQLYFDSNSESEVKVSVDFKKKSK